MRITILSGPYAGQSRDIDAQIVDPLALLADLVRRNCEWHIDWTSDTSPSDAFIWARADLVWRITRALQRGRRVTFGETTFTARQDIEQVAGQIEDAIVQSGLHVFIARDDNAGVIIGIGPPEHVVQ
jgi:hypothetical protein